MPFVQLTLHRGKPPATIHAILDSIQQALEEDFGITAAGRFQAVHEVEPGYLVVPGESFGLTHGDDPIFVHITAKVGRDAAKKKALFATIARLVAERTDIPGDDVIIVLADAPPENWSFGGGVAQLLG